jgi:hypothetical protein
LTPIASAQTTNTLPSLPLRIIKRIFEMAAFHDVDLQALCFCPQLGRRAFPFLNTLGSVNSWARAFTNQLLEHVVVIRDVKHARSFLKYARQGAPARVLVIAPLSKLPSPVLLDVLRAASSVEHLAINCFQEPFFDPRLLEMSSLSSELLGLSQDGLEADRPC